MINGCLSCRDQGHVALGGDFPHADNASDAMVGRIAAGHWAVNPGLLGCPDAALNDCGDNVALFRVLMA